ncbi:MAG TPA: KH domain-containing protein [Candidatus Paceibacterota bacterium]|nr:KH domain-containing protein [Candidatus Paceibacterota bacterium]
MEPDQAFLEYVVKALVDRPDAVVTTRTIDQMGVLLTLTVHPDDMGKIIGKSGKTAEALRILLRVVGMKGNARANLKINEPVGGKRAPEVADEPKTKTIDDVVDEL